MDSREAFEKSFIERYSKDFDHPELLLTRDEKGEYHTVTPQYEWKGWQAALSYAQEQSEPVAWLTISDATKDKP